MLSKFQKKQIISLKKLIIKQLHVYALILLYLVSSTCSFAQIDSLEQLLPTLPENKQKVDVLNELSYLYHNNDIQQTFDYANEAFALTNDLNYLKGKTAAFHNLGIANSISGNIQEAMKFNDKAIHLADSIKAYKLLIKAYQSKGFIQNLASNPEIAIQFFQKSYDLAEQENYPSGIILACLSLGNSYADLEEFDKARVYYNRAISSGKSIKNKSDIAWGLRSIAKTYYDEKNYTKADTIFKKALNIAREANDKRALSFALSEYANNHLKLGKKELAEQYMLESIQLIQAVGDNEGEILGFQDLAELYLETNQPNKVIEISNQALALNKKNSSSIAQIDLLDILSDAYVQKQEFKTAYEINQLAQAKRDSLDYTNKLNLTAELEEKYQSKKKEAENRLLRAEQLHQTDVIAQQKSINFFLGIVAFLLAILGYFIFTAYRNKERNNLILEEKVAARTLELQKTNTQLVQSNEELSRFAYVASHDLREPLRNITNFTQLLQKELQATEKEEVLQFMDIINKNTAHMNNLIMDTLEFTQLSNKTVKKAAVNLNHTIQNIQSSIATRLKNRNATINILQALPIVHANEGLLFSVFKNLIENGINYNESTAPIININHSTKETDYIFSINDNGIGIPKDYQETIFKMFKRLQNRDKYEGSGMGLANCKKIIDKLGGKIWVESDGVNGATFFFTLPKVEKKKTGISSKKRTGKSISLSV